MLGFRLTIGDNILVSVCPPLYKQVKTRNTAVFNNITYNICTMRQIVIDEFDLIIKIPTYCAYAVISYNLEIKRSIDFEADLFFYIYIKKQYIIMNMIRRNFVEQRKLQVRTRFLSFQDEFNNIIIKILEFFISIYT